MAEKILSLWNSEMQIIVINTVVYFLIYFIGCKISNFVIKTITSEFDKKAIHWNFISKIIKSGLLIIAILGISSEIPGLDGLTTTLIASSTVIVAAIGLASQESMANVVSGMFISIFRPFAVGDRIKLSSHGLVGTIEDINLRHTIVKTIENNRLIIPNTTMNKEIVENFNYEDGRIFAFLDVKISVDSDILTAKEIMSLVIAEHPNHVDWRSEEDKTANVPLANVMVRNIADEAIELRVGVWAADIGTSFRLCSDLRQSIVIKFKENNIKLYQKVVIYKEES